MSVITCDKCFEDFCEDCGDGCSCAECYKAYCAVCTEDYMMYCEWCVEQTCEECFDTVHGQCGETAQRSGNDGEGEVELW